ncbi:MAG TPA: TauD/TfdA family dioxygenase, partial [Ilumatobacteraceae bacterium]
MIAPAFAIEDEGSGRCRLLIQLGDREIELPALWLRERSAEPSELDAVTGQRLFDPHLLPLDLHVTAVTMDGGALVVTFSDGHVAHFDGRHLLTNLTLSDGLPEIVLWRADRSDPPHHDWAAIAAEDHDAELAALEDFLALGVAVFDNVATEAGSLLAIANRFGFVRDTNFGPVFDVRSVAQSTDLAYRSVALSPHTDNPYRTPVPGIQILHCLVNETTGGQSTLVDGLAVIDHLRRHDPDAIRVLAETPVRFRYRDAETDIVTVRPILDLDHDGVPVGLNYSPRLDEMPLMPDDETRRYHAARQSLPELLADDAFEMRFTLGAGQLMMFA